MAESGIVFSPIPKGETQSEIIQQTDIIQFLFVYVINTAGYLGKISLFFPKSQSNAPP